MAPSQNAPHKNAVGMDSHVGKNSIAAENAKGKRKIAQKIFCRDVIGLFPDVGWMRRFGFSLRPSMEQFVFCGFWRNQCKAQTNLQGNQVCDLSCEQIHPSQSFAPTSHFHSCQAIRS
jgi:hypothetical protein